MSPRFLVLVAAAAASLAACATAVDRKAPATDGAPPVIEPAPGFPDAPGALGPCLGDRALAIEGGEDEPNRNGTLVSYSLDGTSREVLFEGVSDVYPQGDGSIVAKRRVSRSGHLLLYAAPGKLGRPAVFAEAFDLADAAVGPGGRRAAAIVRMSAASDWELVIAALPPGTSGPRRVALPEGVRPEGVRWRLEGDPDDVSSGTGHPIVLIGSREDKPARFGLADLDGTPRWESLPAYVESEAHDFILSKSHSLGVEQTEIDGRPAVRVAYFWWHGAVEDIAVLGGMTLDGYRWACLRGAVFVTGREGEGYTAKTVVLRGGRVLTAVGGASRPVKLFEPPARPRHLP